jgi:NADP-dependent 3-hydroxy acid dehydrogenase YdfG
MPPVILAEYSRWYLTARSAGHAENPTSVIRQVAFVRPNAIAEHVFLAMSKPDESLVERYPVSALP